MESAVIFLFTHIISTEGFIVLGALIVLYLGLHRKKREAGLYFLSAAGLLVSTSFLKETFRIPRPDNGLVEVTGYAFPSGHAAGAAFLALSICYFARKQKKPLRYVVYTAAVIFALAVGLSRVAFNVHTPLQVLSGLALGALWVWIFATLDRRRT